MVTTTVPRVVVVSVAVVVVDSVVVVVVVVVASATVVVVVETVSLPPGVVVVSFSPVHATNATAKAQTSKSARIFFFVGSSEFVFYLYCRKTVNISSLSIIHVSNATIKGKYK